jgi:hypothetical protein
MQHWEVRFQDFSRGVYGITPRLFFPQCWNGMIDQEVDLGEINAAGTGPD